MYEMKMSEEKNRLSNNVAFSLDHSTIETKSLYHWTFEYQPLAPVVIKVLSIHICALILSNVFSNVVNYNYGYSTHGRHMSIKNCGMAVRGENRSTLETVPVPFHSTFNALEFNPSCGEKPATTALAMAQRIHTSTRCDNLIPGMAL
jgi:hypothetical protein